MGYLKNKFVAVEFLAERMLEGKPFYVAYRELREHARELGLCKGPFRITQREYGWLKWNALDEYEKRWKDQRLQ